MELASQQQLPVDQQQAWEALNDIELLARAIPGCESITASGENTYDLLVAAAIGPVKAKFKGKLELLDIQAPNAYTMQFNGQGGPAGFGKGSARVELSPGADGGTTLSYSVNAQVGGKIAQVGSRLVEMAAQKMAQEFFDKFRQVLIEKYPPPASPAAAPEVPVPAAAPQGLLARIWAAIRRLFGAG